MSEAWTRSNAMNRLVIVLRFVLAALFLAAGVSKLEDPNAFALEIDRYELFPALAPYVAITLPALEVVLALALVLLSSAWRRAAALVCFGLMLVFSFAASAALARDLNIDCGCFGSGTGPITWLTLVRDGALLLVSGLLIRRA